MAEGVWAVRLQVDDRAAPSIRIIDPIRLDHRSIGVIKAYHAVLGVLSPALHRLHEKRTRIGRTVEQRFPRLYIRGDLIIEPVDIRDRQLQYPLKRFRLAILESFARNANYPSLIFRKNQFASSQAGQVFETPRLLPGWAEQHLAHIFLP